MDLGIEKGKEAFFTAPLAPLERPWALFYPARPNLYYTTLLVLLFGCLEFMISHPSVRAMAGTFAHVFVCQAVPGVVPVPRGADARRRHRSIHRRVCVCLRVFMFVPSGTPTPTRIRTSSSGLGESESESERNRGSYGSTRNGTRNRERRARTEKTKSSMAGMPI